MLSSYQMRRLAALALPAEAFKEVLAIISELLANEERRRERNRDRMRDVRARTVHEPCANHTLHLEDTSFGSIGEERTKEMCAHSASTVHAQQFDEFWSIYPNKVGKPAALKAFPVALRKVSLADLIVGLRRYMVHKPADRQWLNPATFLNQERWADQPAKVESNGNGKAPSGLAAIKRLQQRLEEGEMDFGKSGNGRDLLPER